MNGSYVYVINGKANTNCVKIGITASLGVRLSAIKTYAPFEVELFDELRMPTKEIALAVERALHERFKARRFRGEWFNVHPIEASACLVSAYGRVMAARGISDEELDRTEGEYLWGKIHRLERLCKEMEAKKALQP